MSAVASTVQIPLQPQPPLHPDHIPVYSWQLLSSFRGDNMQRCACIPYAFCRRFPLLSRWLGVSLLSAGRRCHGNVGRLTAGLGSGDVSDVIFLTRQSDGSLGCNLCTAAGAAREREHKGRKMGVLNWNYKSWFSAPIHAVRSTPHPSREDWCPPDQRGSRRTAIRCINSH